MYILVETSLKRLRMIVGVKMVSNSGSLMKSLMVGIIVLELSNNETDKLFLLDFEEGFVVATWGQ